jgi:hypothetical protein
MDVARTIDILLAERGDMAIAICPVRSTRPAGLLRQSVFGRAGWL